MALPELPTKPTTSPVATAWPSTKPSATARQVGEVEERPVRLVDADGETAEVTHTDAGDAVHRRPDGRAEGGEDVAALVISEEEAGPAREEPVVAPRRVAGDREPAVAGPGGVDRVHATVDEALDAGDEVAGVVRGRARDRVDERLGLGGITRPSRPPSASPSPTGTSPSDAGAAGCSVDVVSSGGTVVSVVSGGGAVVVVCGTSVIGGGSWGLAVCAPAGSRAASSSPAPMSATPVNPRRLFTSRVLSAPEGELLRDQS